MQWPERFALLCLAVIAVTLPSGREFGLLCLEVALPLWLALRLIDWGYGGPEYRRIVRTCRPDHRC